MKKSQLRAMIKEEMKSIKQEGQENLDRWKQLKKDAWITWAKSTRNVKKIMSKEWEKLHKKYPEFEDDEFLDTIEESLEEHGAGESTVAWEILLP